MRRRWLEVWSAIQVLLFALPIHAHTLKTDGTIGVTLHIDPDDEPVAGQEAKFFVAVRDLNRQFEISNCECILQIIKDDVELAFIQLVPAGDRFQTKYTFPASGNYEIIIFGAPIEDTAFQSFRTRFDYYVQAGLVGTTMGYQVPTVTKIEQTYSLKRFIPHVATAGILALLAIFFLGRSGRRTT